MIAGDRLGAYGGLHRFRDIDRMVRLNENVLLTYTGDVADFQALKGFFIKNNLFLTNVFFLEYMVETQRESDMADDGVKLGPVEYFNMLERIMYNRR